MSNILKVGVFVDAENIRMNGGFQMRYDVLRRFSVRENGLSLRLNTYLSYDPVRAQQDPEYAYKNRCYQQMVRDFGWKISIKEVRRYTDDDGSIKTKANADLDLAVDVLQQVENLDQILLVTGDGDFLKVVQAVQSKGCRVELLAFNNISGELIRQVDAFYSGYLIPDLLPITYEPRNDWGAEGGVVRGICTKWFSDKGYGFFRYIRHVDDKLWVTDTRTADSPYASVFFHVNELAQDVTEEHLNNRDNIFEFYLQESPQKDAGLAARDIRLAPR